MFTTSRRLTFLTLFSLLASTHASPPPPAVTQTASRVNQVIHPAYSSSKCLTAASSSNGAAVEIEDCVPNAANQLWTITGSTVQIFGDMCLDDTNGNRADGQKLQIYKCFNGNTNQMWVNNGLFFQLKGTSKCMDNTNGNRNNGNVVQIWDCTGGGNQQWNVRDGSTVTTTVGPTTTATIPPAPTKVIIQPIKQSETCLTVPTNANSAPVIIEPCDGSDSQHWVINNGKITIYGDKCLDVTNGSTANGVKMQVYTCYAGNTNQQFTFATPLEFPDAKIIKWVGHNECLDLTDSNLTDGTQMQMWTCGNDNHNQIWSILKA